MFADGFPKMLRTCFNFSVLLLCLSFISSSPSLAQKVRPGEVAIIAAAGNAESQSLAAYYCEKRGVQQERVLSLSFPDGTELNRKKWELEIKPQIQKWLAESDPDGEIRCFVTTFGVPLAIAAIEPDSNQEMQAWGSFYSLAIDDRIASLNASLEEIAQLSESEFQAVVAATTAGEIGERFDEIATACQKKIATLSTQEREKANQILQRNVRIVAGLSPFINGMRAQLTGQSNSTSLAAQLERVLGIQQGYSESLAALDRLPSRFASDIAILQTLEKNVGLLGAIDWLRKQKEIVEANDSIASFDSELCLVQMDSYRRIGTFPLSEPNILNSLGPDGTYRVTRIDGPTVEVARSLIDRAIAIDEPTEGEQRNVYIDKRGLAASASPKDLKVEAWLEKMANRFRDGDDFNVTVEEGPSLFEVGACPKTSVYIGWYGLGKFKDAFTFAPGAVAYHVVPGDALGIHDPTDTGWCKGFLEKGATYVVGSISAPVVVDFADDDSHVRPRRTNCSDGSVIFGDFMYAKE